MRSINTLNENNLIEKSKPLIWAKFRQFNTHELKLIETYLSRIDARNPESRHVKFTKTEYCRLMGLHPDTKPKQLSQYTQHLLENSIELNIGDEYEQYTLFSVAKCKMDKELGQTVIELSCNYDLKDVFFNFAEDGYIKYRLRNIVNLKSQYSIRLYSLLKDRAFGKYEWKVDLEELKELLSAKEKSYETFKVFNRSILQKAAKEINDNTDIQFTYEKILQGRRVVGIFFKIREEKEEKIKVIEEKGKEKPEWERSLIEENKEYKKINDESFDGSFTLEETKYLVYLGEKRVNEITKEIVNPEEKELLKIEYYKEKYLEMLSRKPKSKKGLLAYLLRNDTGSEVKNKKNNYKNKFNNFEGREYDWEQLENQLLNN